MVKSCQVADPSLNNNSLKGRIEYRKCTLVYKAQTGLGTQYLWEMFTPVSEVHMTIVYGYVKSGIGNKLK